MAVDLIYKHQQKTYDLMNEALEENGRAAYVYPTGCGKSFPALKYVEDNSGKTATIVVPSNFIKKQYEKNIKKYVENGSERLKSGSIKIATYQDRYFKAKKHESKVKKIKEYYRNKVSKGINVLNKSLKLSKKLIPFMESDIVIFDEIHRMGAPEWEKIVDKMMKENPKRKVIGMSATPERTNRRNMAYEKFGDDVVYEMSLTEALSGEKEGEVLLKSPNYVRVLSLLKSELPKYKEQIDLLEDEEKKDKCLKAYQKLDTIVSNSPDIQDIIAVGMKKTNGKYIVFCKDRDDMFDKIEHANEIFGKVNSKINIDYVITKISGGEDKKGKTKFENDKTLDAFESRENGDGLNLLFCVDMLNEGVHLDGIDGEVLFDLTKSPILYKQRIGRVLSSDKNAGDAVIIDAANNWLTQIETYREIEMAIQAGQKREKEDEEKDWDLLKLLPEELELIEILREIGEELKYNNKFDFEEFANWLKYHGGKLPRSVICIKYERLTSDEMTKEEKDEVKLRRSWFSSKEREVLENYIGKEIEEIPEEYREKIQVLRNYGLGLEDKNVYDEIIEWLVEHDGKMPRRAISVKSRQLSVDEMTREENDEVNLRSRWNYSSERKILEKYKGKDLEEIPEEYREKIQILRSYGLGLIKKNVYEELVEWLKEHDGKMPRGAISINSKKLSVGEMSEDEIYETRLYDRWYQHSEEYRVLVEYTGKKLEEIPEKYRKKIETLRSYGLGIKSKTTYDQIIEWLETHNGSMPRPNIIVNNHKKNANEMTAEENYEVNLYARWRKNSLKEILEMYMGKTLEEIPEEYRENIKKLRSYGIGIEEKCIYDQMVEWLKNNNGMLPRSAIIQNGKKIPRKEFTEKQHYEISLRDNWRKSIECKVLEQYKGRRLEEIPEEYREKARVLRSYGLGLTKDEKIKRKMQKAVGKQVTHNEETRQELEGPDKTFVVEDSDVEK